jgi:hypothetical protein
MIKLLFVFYLTNWIVFESLDTNPSKSLFLWAFSDSHECECKE